MYKMWKKCGSIEYVANVFKCGQATVKKVIRDKEQKGARPPKKEKSNQKSNQKR
jgi:hypothetical protein